MISFGRIFFLQATPDIPLQSVLKSSSVQAEHINRLANYFYIAAGFILLVVAALTAYAVYRYRDKNAPGAPGKGPNPKWEIVTIGVPVLLVAVFLYLNLTTIRRVEPDRKGQQPDVVITGHQWWWEAVYPSDSVTTANEIHLPVGQNLLLKLLAADVIHDWWIPQFGNKMDMVPSVENYLSLNIRKPGVYWGVCSEFCGTQHAHMRIKVVAQTSEDFQQWLQGHKKPAEDKMVAGAQLFQQLTCGNCHRINGTAANGRAGPDLTHLGSRQTLLAGMLENSRQNLESWIKNPQSIKPGAHMPDFKLEDSAVTAIAAYLYSLK